MATFRRDSAASRVEAPRARAERPATRPTPLVGREERRSGTAPAKISPQRIVRQFAPPGVLNHAAAPCLRCALPAWPRRPARTPSSAARRTERDRRFHARVAGRNSQQTSCRFSGASIGAGQPPLAVAPRVLDLEDGVELDGAPLAPPNRLGPLARRAVHDASRAPARWIVWTARMRCSCLCRWREARSGLRVGSGGRRRGFALRGFSCCFARVRQSAGATPASSSSATPSLMMPFISASALRRPSPRSPPRPRHADAKAAACAPGLRGADDWPPRWPRG